MKKEIKPKAKVMFILLTIFAILISVSSVSATSTVYVNATGGSDSNSGTIDHPYQTIAQGISSVDENGTVYIADGVYSGTGNTNITLSRSMNITGQSQTGTIINGTGINWIFKIPNGLIVTIQNLTITKAHNVNFVGGAISNDGTLTVTGCSFTANTKVGAGAGIYNSINGVLKVVNSNFRDNVASYSCTIHSYGVCTVENSTFINNTATTGNGGAIGIGGGTLNVTGSTFTNNHADYGGVIVTNRGTTSEIHYCSFIGNTAPLGNFAYNGGSLNATNNWWGNNTNPKTITNLIYNYDGSSDVSSWIVMTISANNTTINNNGTSTITVDFNHYRTNEGTNGTISGGHIPDRSITLNVPWGSFTNSVINHSITISTLNGITNAIFYANEGAVNSSYNPVKVTATADGYTTNGTESAYITIKPAANLYVNIKSSNSNPKVGETFTLTYKLGNGGPDAASNVTITIPVPANFEISKITGDGNWTYNETTRTITWTLANVPKGDPYLYITGKTTKAGTYSFGSSITSDTYNLNTEGVTPLTINAATEVKAASNTVPMQTTGMPIAGLVLAILAVLGGTLVPRKK